MKKFCLWGGFFVSVMLCGCKETVDDSVFLVDASKAVEANFSEVATDFRIIRLKSDAPLDTRMQYFFYDKWILGLSPIEGIGHPRVNLFDKDGNLVSVLNRVGRGPGEYIGINEIISLDEEKGILYVLANMDAGMPILKYSIPDFSYLGKVELGDGYEIRDIGPLDSGRFLALLNHGGNGPDHYSGVARTVLFDINNLNDTVVLYTDTWNRHNNLFESFAYETNRHNPLFRTTGYVNTIYILEDRKLTPAFKFTFGDNGVPKKIYDDFEKNPDSEEMVSSIDGGIMNYVLDNNGCHIPYTYYALRNGELISFLYMTSNIANGLDFNTFFYLNDGSKSVSYSNLRIPGLTVDASVSSVDGNMYVWEIPNSDDLIDKSVPMSPLAREIVDSLKAQNDDNPVLLEYRFTF